MAGLIDNERYARYYQRLSLVYQKPEIKASLEIILSVFMITTLILLAIRPTVTNVASLQKKIADQEAMGAKADKKIGQLFNAQNQLTTHQNSLPLFEKAVGNKFSYFDMISRIELLARKNNLTIDSLNGPGSKAGGLEKISNDFKAKIVKVGSDGSLTTEISIVVYGQPSDVSKFLVQVENMDKLVMINSVLFVKESESSRGSQKLKTTVLLQFYFLPESK